MQGRALGKLVEQKSVEFVVAMDIVRDVRVFNSSHNLARAFISDHHIQCFFDGVKRKRQGDRAGHVCQSRGG